MRSRSTMIPKVGRRIARYSRIAVELPQWLWFVGRMRNSSALRAASDVGAVLGRKEVHVGDLLQRIAGGRFLEIGIGSYPNIARHRLIEGLGIEYFGADRAQVCALHSSVLASEKLRPRTFFGNTAGSYVWTLFELVQRGESYDAIFLDGHHTLYVDLPAMLLADRLLRNGGYLMLDDTKWTLAFLRENLCRSFGEWSFYRQVYDFDEYTPEQQQLPHISQSAELMLLNNGEYTKVDDLSTDEWWTLKKRS